jgi:hypothetical protein
LDKFVSAHVERLTLGALKRYGASNVSKWVLDHTYYAGKPYSFVDHEYQERILNEAARDVVVKKCSQVGISEVSVRQALALVNILNPYTVAYTLPTAGFAGTFTKTRVDPVIQGSKTLKFAVHKTNDNNEVKQFGDSMLFFRGAASSNAPISIPCDHLIHDEVDFSDQEVLGQYVSRLTHSKWKRTTKISTPTLPGFGIDKAFQSSKRHFMHVKCHHCNHWFIPDYYKHVKIPGFRRDLREVNKQTLTQHRWQEAQVHCPNCDGKPMLGIAHREWVCENPGENHPAVGIQVSPFDAPNIITPAYLVETSTKYDRVQDFVNFNLGQCAEDSEATLSEEDFKELFVLAAPSPSVVHVMGVDVGNTYHFTVGSVDPWGRLHVVYTEQVPMGLARLKYIELQRRYRIICTVMDANPHAETVMALQGVDQNLFAAVYTQSRSLLTHTVIDKNSSPSEGKHFVRQVNINRSRSFDAYMEFLRSGSLTFQMSENRGLLIKHHTSMKRVRQIDHESGEPSFSWQKTDGEDHFHHACQYLYMASKIMGVGAPMIQLPTCGVMKFRLKQ